MHCHKYLRKDDLNKMEKEEFLKLLPKLLSWQQEMILKEYSNSMKNILKYCKNKWMSDSILIYIN